MRLIKISKRTLFLASVMFFTFGVVLTLGTQMLMKQYRVEERREAQRRNDHELLQAIGDGTAQLLDEAGYKKQVKKQEENQKKERF